MRRALVVDEAAGLVENVIVLDDDGEPPELPGRLVVVDEWGASPGDVWDPEQRRPWAPAKEIETEKGEPVVALEDQRRALIRSAQTEIEAALERGDTDAAMAVVLRVHDTWRQLEKEVPGVGRNLGA